MNTELNPHLPATSPTSKTSVDPMGPRCAPHSVTRRSARALACLFTLAFVLAGSSACPELEEGAELGEATEPLRNWSPSSLVTVDCTDVPDRIDVKDLGIFLNGSQIVQLGAIGDGRPHPLSERFSTLSHAQTYYPFATDLSDEIDWAAIQRAVDIALICQAPSYVDGSRGMVPVEIPYGRYLVNRTIEVGPDSAAVTNGFMLSGSTARASEILWTGTAGNGSSQGPLRVVNVNWFHMQDLTIRGKYTGEFGVWLMSDHGMTCGRQRLSNVAIENFSDGLRVGHAYTAGVHSSPALNDYSGLDIHNAHNAVHIIGTDTDGQQFYNLNTANITGAVIRVEGGRNVHVTGGNDWGVRRYHTEPGNADALTTAGRTYLHITGSAIGGGFSVRNIRVESAAELVRVGPDEPSQPRTDGFTVEIDNYVVQTVHRELEETLDPIRIVHWAGRGTLQIENSVLPYMRGHLYFHRLNSLQNIELAMENNQLTISEEDFYAEPSDPLAFIQTSPRPGSGVVEVGGLRATLRNNVRLDRRNIGSYRLNDVVGRFRDQVRLYTAADAHGYTYTVLEDLRATPQTAANVWIDPFWGVGAVVTEVSGTDRAFTFHVVTGQTGLDDNPRLQVDFADGDYTSPPQVLTQLVGVSPMPSTGLAASITLNEASENELEMTFVGTPEETTEYVFRVFVEP